MDIINLDISKAFDSVPHRELLLKLNSQGISRNFLVLFECYLSQHTQYVSIGS